jgi:serine/threonine-protein kinase
MAVVYLARDLRHDRAVALKVLRPETTAVLGRERFVREIRLAARLQHPYILPVHDSSDLADGGEEGEERLWFTMPYVEGESLRDRLRREGRLPLAEAARITREVAHALDYAHGRGVVHRDVKPENILLTADGQPLLADFGVARAASSAAGGEGGVLTFSGFTVGTPAYMSPEQAAAERQLDGRSDQYSLACVLFEMLAGEPPFARPSAQAGLVRRMNGEVPSVRAVAPTVPPAVDAVLRRAMAAAPAGRFATAAEMSRALEAAVRAPAAAEPAAEVRGAPSLGGAIRALARAVRAWLPMRRRGD